MRKYISKKIASLIKFFTKIQNRLEANLIQSNSNKFDDLTPTDKVEDKNYCEALSWALSNRNIKNIAVTGPYGSGKSSVLQSFFKKNPIHNSLNISLASFNAEGTPPENLNRLIERSILQQIFYREKSSKIPDSRFKRIRNWKPRKLLLLASLATLWFVSSFLFFSPKLLKNIALWNSSSLQYNTTFSYIYTSVFLTGILIILFLAIRMFKNSKFSKVNLMNGEIEVNKDVESSILNKHLDEILYFFEVRDYNVVIFEDLDRFNKTDIFTKLREINLLLNQSKQIDRHIVFIYAIKDEMFQNKDRTKFFDFIVPIIPIINSSNSEELLLKKLNGANDNSLLTKDFVRNISLYIDDMRVLKNIFNEFIIYQNKLNAVDLDPDKLFSIILYKNLYPEDFAMLHENKGIIHDIFSSKKDYIKEINHETSLTINELKALIEATEKEHLKNTKELREIYISKFYQKIFPYQCRTIKLNGNVDISSLATTESFEKLKLQKNISYTNLNGYNNSINFSFSELEKEIDPNGGYNKREEILLYKNDNRIEGFKKELEKLIKEQEYIKDLSLQHLIKRYNNTSILNGEIQDKKLLIYLIRNGYINEMYHSYTSYFYPGSLSKEDKNFILSIKDYSALPFNQNLSNFEEILSRISDYEFKQKEILNYKLFEFLITNKSTYQTQFTNFIEQLANETKESLDFINGYIELNNSSLNTFIKLLCAKWQYIWGYIDLESNYSDEKKDQYLKLILKYANAEDLKKESDSYNALLNYISDKENFISLFSEETDYFKNIKDIISSIGVKFKNIKNPELSPELFDYIYKNDLYEINKEMIATIIKERAEDSSIINRLDKANLSTIKESKCTNLIAYIDENINTYIKNTFLKIETNTKEVEGTIIGLLNNEIIETKTKNNIIINTPFLISDISSVEDDTLWNLIFTRSKISSNWENIIKYYEKESKLDDTLINFLSIRTNYIKLLNKKIDSETSTDNKQTQKISKELILCRKISTLSFNYLVTCIPYTYNRLKFQDLSLEKIQTLLSLSFLNLTEYNLTLLKEYFDPLHISLIESNIEEYIDKIDSFEQNENDLRLLLQSTIIKYREKLKIIQKYQFDNISINNSLADIIIQLLHSSQFKLDSTLASKLLTTASQIEEKINLLNSQINFHSSEEISELIEVLPNPYSNISKRGSRPLITNNHTNRKFVENLKELNLISSYKDEKNRIRVNTKRY